MLTHANLIRNSEMISVLFQNNHSKRGVSWLPMYHDMGLVGGVLSPVYMSATMTLMSPMSFMQRPIRWLKTISKYQATTSGGPNFAYQLCVDKVTEEELETLDLSSWGSRVQRCRTRQSQYVANVYGKVFTMRVPPSIAFSVLWHGRNHTDCNRRPFPTKTCDSVVR